MSIGHLDALPLAGLPPVLYALLSRPDCMLQALSERDDGRWQPDNAPWFCQIGPAQTQPRELAAAAIAQQLTALAAQAERLLDIYLAGALPVDKYTARAAAIAAQQAPLVARRSELLLAREAAPGVPVGVPAIAEKLAARLAEVGDDADFRRYVIERLDVQVVLYAAAGPVQWSLTCLLGAGAGVLPI